jgi:hypothetical protein
MILSYEKKIQRNPTVIKNLEKQDAFLPKGFDRPLFFRKNRGKVEVHAGINMKDC